jgi:hypothetical protein
MKMEITRMLNGIPNTRTFDVKNALVALRIKVYNKNENDTLEDVQKIFSKYSFNEVLWLYNTVSISEWKAREEIKKIKNRETKLAREKDKKNERGLLAIAALSLFGGAFIIKELLKLGDIFYILLPIMILLLMYVISLLFIRK